MDSEYKLPTVEEIAGMMGLPSATARKLLGMAPERLDSIQADIRAGLAAGDMDSVARHAHAARGVCSNLRLQPIVDTALTIEQNAKKRLPAAYSAGLCDRLGALTEELRRMLSGGSPA
jgi:HPt (histidine-containing phosphotransfer) domain-containing protein